MKKLLWITLWVSFPFGIVSFLPPIYDKDLGASAVEIGGYFSAFSLVPALIRLFIGQALDKYARRPFLIAGLAGYVLSTLNFFTDGHDVIADSSQIFTGIWVWVFVDIW